jgi:site-specific DNA-methyltransferase (adenine-specific)
VSKKGEVELLEVTKTEAGVRDLREHKAAAVVPLMSDAEYADLVADVKDAGVKVPLDVLPDGRVLDGRNRLRAAREAGLATVPVRVLDLDEAGAVEHVYRTAVLRRNLSDDQRAVLLARLREGLSKDARRKRGRKAAQARWQGKAGCSGNTSSPKHPGNGAVPKGNGRTAEVLARQGNVPVRKVKDAARLEAEAPDLAGEVLAGATTLARARREVGSRKKLKELAAKADRTASRLKEAGALGEEPWEVRHGDCLAELAKVKAGTVRLVFADPPYNEGVDYGKGEGADRLPDEAYLEWCRKWLAECARVLTDDGSLWVLISEDYADYVGLMLRDEGLHRRRWLVWEETFGVHLQDNFGRCARHLFYCVKDPERFVFHAEAVRVPSDRQTKYNDKRADPAGRVMPNVLHFSRVMGNHPERVPGVPTQLPLDLLRLVVGCASDPGDLVLDPFCGSGTTGAACVELRRHFLGIEEQAGYVKLSKQRLLAAVDLCGGQAAP